MGQAAGLATGTQTFTVTPSEAADAVASAATDNTGSREYTVAGLTDATEYNVALVVTDNVTDTDGTISFADAGSDSLADGIGGTDAAIEQIDGSATDQTDAQTFTASGTSATFLVDSELAANVTPVVWLDAETTGDNALDVDADGLPTEDFAVGGSITWISAEAADGAPGADQAITSVNKSMNYFQAAGSTYYSAADTFQILDGAACDTVSQAAFEAALSTGDDLLNPQSSYINENDGNATNGASTFCIDDLAPAATANVAAVATSSSTVDVTFDEVTGVDSYNVYRYEGAFDDAGITLAADFTLIGTVDAAGDTDTGTTNTFEDTGLIAETEYTYNVTTVLDGDESAEVTLASGMSATTLVAGDTLDAVSNDVTVITDAGVGAFDEQGTVSNGDEWRILFDEPVTIGTAAIRVVDGDTVDVTTAGDFTLSQNAAAVVIDGEIYAANEVLTVTVDATPTTTFNYPAEITLVTGFTTAGGGEWDLATSADTTLDVNESAPATLVPGLTVVGDPVDVTEGSTSETFSVELNSEPTSECGHHGHFGHAQLRNGVPGDADVHRRELGHPPGRDGDGPDGGGG